MTKIQTLGHEITFDWTQNDPEPPEHLTIEEYLEDCAISDADGVMDADILVLLVHPKLAGGFVELGLALGWNIPVIAVDRHLSNCVFLNMPTVRHARDEAQVLEWLGHNDDVDSWIDAIRTEAEMADESRVNGERLALESGNPEFLRGDL